jgi:hypothetical protein
VLCSFKRRFYCCYPIVIRLDLPDVSPMLETDIAPVRLQFYVETSVKLWLKDDDTDLYRHRIKESILHQGWPTSIHIIR